MNRNCPAFKLKSYQLTIFTRTACLHPDPGILQALGSCPYERQASRLPEKSHYSRFQSEEGRYLPLMLYYKARGGRSVSKTLLGIDIN